MKHLLSFSLLLLLFGCTAVQTDTSPPAAKTTLKIALWDYNKTSYDRKLIQAFEAQHPEIQIEVISYPDTYYEGKLSSLLDSGQLVDVIYFRDATSLQAAYRRGQLLPLDEFTEALPLSSYRGAADLRKISDDGLLYALPYRWDHAVLYFNRDMFDRAEIPYPADSMTWDAFCVLAQRLKEVCQADEYPLMLLPDPMQNYWQMCIKPVRFEQDELRPIGELAALVNQFQTLEIMPAYAQNLMQNVGQRLFESGRYGMYLGGSWYMNYLYHDEQAERFRMNWGAVNSPVWAEARANEQNVVISSLAINRQTPTPQAAWTFVNFVTGAMGAEMMAQEYMIPAYLDDNVSAVFSSLSHSHDISQAVYTWDNAAPVRTSNARELKIRDMVFDEYLHAVTGNKTAAQALIDMEAARDAMLALP